MVVWSVQRTTRFLSRPGAWGVAAMRCCQALTLRGMHVRFPAAVMAVLAAVAVGGALWPLPAAADGDPASDVLLGENVFYPYSPPVPATVQRKLNAVTAAAKRAGFPIKVALIGSGVDLGVIPDLFGKPQRYADFLDQEISFNVKQPVLVVMPAGLGGAGLGSRATVALGGVPRPAGAQPTDLAQSAIQAVPKLAAAAGHPIQAGGAASSSGGSATSTGGPSAVLVFALPLLLVAVVVATLTVRGRRRDQAS